MLEQTAAQITLSVETRKLIRRWPLFEQTTVRA